MCEGITAPRARLQVAEPPAGREFSRSFPGRPDQAGAARAFVRGVLPPSEVTGDVVLAASELITNALSPLRVIEAFADLVPDGGMIAGMSSGLGSVANNTYQPGNKSYCTSLFCFNRAFKVPPSYIQNLSLGYTFYPSTIYFRPEIFFTNLFDHTYLLKGAFFSGASVGRPFMAQFRLSIGV